MSDIFVMEFILYFDKLCMMKYLFVHIWFDNYATIQNTLLLICNLYSANWTPNLRQSVSLMDNQVYFRFVVEYKNNLEYCIGGRYVNKPRTCTQDRVVLFPSSRFPLTNGYFHYLATCLSFPKEIAAIISQYTFKIPIELYWHFNVNGAKFVLMKHITLREYNDLLLQSTTRKYHSSTYKFDYFEVSRKYTDVKTTIWDVPARNP